MYSQLGKCGQFLFYCIKYYNIQSGKLDHYLVVIPNIHIQAGRLDHRGWADVILRRYLL